MSNLGMTWRLAIVARQPQGNGCEGWKRTDNLSQLLFGSAFRHRTSLILSEMTMLDNVLVPF